MVDEVAYLWVAAKFLSAIGADPCRTHDLAATGSAVKEAGRSIQQMQKALTTMNVQLANAITDVSGITGMSIIRKILQGERDPRQLAKLRDWRIAASEEEIAHSLEGHWREDVLFELRQVVEAYDFYQQQIAACDTQLEKYLAILPDRTAPREGEAIAAKASLEKPKKPRRSPRKNQPVFDLRAELQRTMGVDLTTVDGIDVMTTQVLLSELGPDLSASFPTEDHFASWLELVPRRDISGGKVIRQKSRHSKNRVANALRMAAQSLSRSQSYLGARYRHRRGRLGGQKAVKAMARYLACLVYRLLTQGQAYVDRGVAYFEGKRIEPEMARLKRKAAQFGMQVVPAP